MSNITRMAEMVDFAISKARCKLGIKKEDINKIEQDILNYMADKKIKIELLHIKETEK